MGREGRRRRRDDRDDDKPAEVLERQKRKREDDALLRSKDPEEIGQALYRFESDLEAKRKGKANRDDEDEIDRLMKKIRILRQRRDDLIAKEKRRERERTLYEQGKAKTQGLKPPAQYSSSSSDAVGEYMIVDGRKVLVAGTGSVPLPQTVSMKAPAPPPWPPEPRQVGTPSPPTVYDGEPPSLRPIPPPPNKARLMRERRETRRMLEEQQQQQEAAQQRDNEELQKQSANPPRQVRATVDMDKLKAQLGK